MTSVRQPASRRNPRSISFSHGFPTALLTIYNCLYSIVDRSICLLCALANNTYYYSQSLVNKCDGFTTDILLSTNCATAVCDFTPDSNSAKRRLKHVKPRFVTRSRSPTPVGCRTRVVGNTRAWSGNARLPPAVTGHDRRYRRTLVLSALIITVTSGEVCATPAPTGLYLQDFCCNATGTIREPQSGSLRLVTNVSNPYQQCRCYLSAPARHVIQLHFRQLYGFTAQAPATSGGESGSGDAESCVEWALPRVEVYEVLPSGSERRALVVCHQGASTQSLESTVTTLILAFSWAAKQRSGLVLDYEFVRKDGVFSCLQGGALPELSLVCNGVRDCRDGSDEDKCHGRTADVPSSNPSKTMQSGSGRAFRYGIAFIALILAAAVLVVCVLRRRLLCPLSAGTSSSTTGGVSVSGMRQSAHAHNGPQCSGSYSERDQFNSSFSTPPCCSQEEVVYVPPARGRQSGAPGSARLTSTPSITHEFSSGDIDASQSCFPPSIPRSADGEEGYLASQLALKYSETNPQEFTGPPPNVCLNREEPPIRRYARSVGHRDETASRARDAVSVLGRQRNSAAGLCGGLTARARRRAERESAGTEVEESAEETAHLVSDDRNPFSRSVGTSQPTLAAGRNGIALPVITPPYGSARCRLPSAPAYQSSAFSGTQTSGYSNVLGPPPPYVGSGPPPEYTPNTSSDNVFTNAASSSPPSPEMSSIGAASCTCVNNTPPPSFHAS